MDELTYILAFSAYIVRFKDTIVLFNRYRQGKPDDRGAPPLLPVIHPILEIQRMNIEIHSTRTCSFCVQARQLLESKGLEFTEIDIGGYADKL